MRTRLQPSRLAYVSICPISGSQRFMSLPPHTVMMQTLPISELIRMVATADSTVRPFQATHNRLRPARMSASISANARFTSSHFLRNPSPSPSSAGTVVPSSKWPKTFGPSKATKQP